MAIKAPNIKYPIITSTATNALPQAFYKVVLEYGAHKLEMEITVTADKNLEMTREEWQKNMTRFFCSMTLWPKVSR